MTRLYITRHGQTEWNVEGRMQGQKNSDLTPLGKEQARWLRDRLKDTEIDVIVSSSSGRALQTAEIVRGDKNIPIIPNDNLREMHIGNWEGMLHTEVKQSYAHEHNNFWNCPHLYQPKVGETFAQIVDRVSCEIEKIIAEYDGRNILIVAHAIVLKALITYFEGKEIKDLWTGAFMHSTCLNIVEIQEGSKEVVLQGDTSHYPDEKNN